MKPIWWLYAQYLWFSWQAEDYLRATFHRQSIK